MSFLLNTGVFLGVTVYRGRTKREANVLVESMTCLEDAKLLVGSRSGELSASLVNASGDIWTFHRLRRLRVPASYRKKFGKRAARELEAQLNRGRS